MSVRTTFVPLITSARRGRGLERLSYLTEREVDGILDALCDGSLVAVADVGECAIVAAATPDLADRLCAANPDYIGELREQLRQSQRELDSLLDIAREVMCEREPGEYLYRLELAIEDVRRGVDGAMTYSEDL